MKSTNSFLKLPNCLLRSPLWRNLPAVDRAVYVDMASEFNGRNNGQIEYSARFGAERLILSKDTVNRSLKHLELGQLIRCTKRGTNRTAKPSLWYLPFCGQLEQMEDGPVSPEGQVCLTRGTGNPKTCLTRGTTRRKKESRNGDSRAKRREAPVHKTKEADQREADIARLDEPPLLTGEERAALGRLAVLANANGGGTTRVSS